MISLDEMTDEQFQQYTLEVLGKALGPGGLARYLRLNRTGSGDYTRDRHLWLDDATMDEIINECMVQEGVSAALKEAS